MTQSENDLFSVRLEKLERLREKGIEPYPNNYDRTHTTEEAIAYFNQQESEQGEDARTNGVSLAGRIVALRGMGKASFADILDGYGRIQTLFRRNTLSESYETLKDLDIGDWIGIRGPLFRTRTGEITVEAQEFTLLCKSLRPLPEKWHGLADMEIRFRQRYLDLISNPEARQIAIMRSRITSAMRRFMDSRGFLEMETPILVPIAAGGMAHPFVTVIPVSLLHSGQLTICMVDSKFISLFYVLNCGNSTTSRITERFEGFVAGMEICNATKPSKPRNSRCFASRCGHCLRSGTVSPTSRYGTGSDTSILLPTKTRVASQPCALES